MDDQYPALALFSDDVDDDHALDCPGCGSALSGDETYERFRVCAICRRHFWLPARARVDLLVGASGFQETNATLASLDPLTFRDPLPLSERMAEERERAGISDAVVTGVAAIGGHEAVLIVLDSAFLGANLGILAGEKVTLAMELALHRRLPLVAICSGGDVRAREGLLALGQLAKTASAAAKLHRAGVPFISVITHPTIGGIYAGLVNQADIIFAEPGSHAGLGARLAPSGGVPFTEHGVAAEALRDRGYVDDVVDRVEIGERLSRLLDLFQSRAAPRPAPPSPAAPSSSLSAAEEASLARREDRPGARALLDRLATCFVELHGDRAGADDRTVIGGLGKIDGATVAIIALDPAGCEPASNQSRGVSAAGYRKIARVIRLAAHLETPLVTLIDAPPPAHAPDDDADGAGVAIGQVLNLISLLPAPVVAVTIGEASGLGSLALAMGDRHLMMEHAIVSARGDRSPRQDSDRLSEFPAPSAITARDCRRLGFVDAIISEPFPAAHADPALAAELLTNAVATALAECARFSARRLIDERSRRIRQLGLATPEGREAVSLELRDLQDIQRSVGRSLHDLRDRFDHRVAALQQRPSLQRINARGAELVDRAGRFTAVRWNKRAPAELDEGDVSGAGRGPASPSDLEP